MRRPQAGDIWRFKPDEEKYEVLGDPREEKGAFRDNWLNVPVKDSEGEEFRDYTVENWERWDEVWEFVFRPSVRICPGCNIEIKIPDDDYLCVACRSAA
jgi:hypothetical protein